MPEPDVVDSPVAYIAIEIASAVVRYSNLFVKIVGAVAEQAHGVLVAQPEVVDSHGSAYIAIGLAVVRNSNWFERIEIAVAAAVECFVELSAAQYSVIAGATLSASIE